ncbi:hypothetical protein FB451DRAFT_1568152 [Mycena latifolia]|nr:hypothetical protein FB451DRAFT_1568152 [Mycena latifolia]
MPISTQDAAAKIAAYLGLIATGFKFIPASRFAVATEEVVCLRVSTSGVKPKTLYDLKFQNLLSELNPSAEGDGTVYEDPNDPIKARFCWSVPQQPPIDFQSAFCAGLRILGSISKRWSLLHHAGFSASERLFMRGPLGSDFYQMYVDRDLISSERKRKVMVQHLLDTLNSLLFLMIIATYANEYQLNIHPLSEDSSERLQAWLATACERSFKVIKPQSTSTRVRIQPGSLNYNYHQRILEHCLILSRIAAESIRRWTGRFATTQDGPELADPVNIPVVRWEADGGADDVFAGTRFERAEARAFSPVACTSVALSPAQPENSEPPSPREGPAAAWGWWGRAKWGVGASSRVGAGNASAWVTRRRFLSLSRTLLSLTNFVNSPGYTFTGLTGGNAPGVVKPAAAWTAQETVRHMLTRVAAGEF